MFELLTPFTSGIEFYTENKTTTSLWRAEDATSDKASVNMPTHS
jgi:malonate-semialdehyde dehydrogenase (acetylating)/methylmalonate-semialdehyde dehydrogenase